MSSAKSHLLLAGGEETSGCRVLQLWTVGLTARGEMQQQAKGNKQQATSNAGW
jgi:hypothetical protein